MDYNIHCFLNAKKGPAVPTPNNFLEEIKCFEVSGVGFKASLSLKHRHFDILSTNIEETSQGITLNYFDNPFEENDILKNEFMLAIDFQNVPYEEYDIIYSRDKEVLDILFIRKDLKQSILKFERLT